MSSDDDLPSLNGARARNGKAFDDSDIGDGNVQDELDDLFGGEVDEDAEKAAKKRQLDDDELDSGDDEGRYDRAPQEEEPETEDFSVMEVNMPRYPAPEPTDGEGYLMKIPRFIAIDPVAFSLHGFQPPTTDHHSTAPPTSSFSAYKTAQTTVRWRHSPSNPSELQSNARILRWSDGSLTLQLASDATTQYDIAPKALAPPQRNPTKPTPTSIHDKTGRTTLNTAYDEKADSYTYLASASESAFIVRVTNKITTSLQVIPSSDGADEALERLQSSMAALRGGVTGSAMVTVERITEDPELAKKKAEQAEKEKLKAQRRVEAQALRERDRTSKVFSRASRPGGLTVGGLEDEEGGGSRRAPRKPARRRRRDDVTDSEEENYKAHGGKEDEYDEEDDFIAGSDEDDERDAEGEDEEDIDAVIESREKEQRANARERLGTPKRDRSIGDEDDEPAAPAHNSPSRTKRRRVVEDEDDE